MKGRVERHRSHALLPRTRRWTLARDSATPVSDDHRYDNGFTAASWVQLDIDEAAEDVDHLISPEELMRVAMSRQ